MTAVTDALAVYDDPVLTGTATWEDAVDALAAVARRVVEADEMWWCQEHDGGMQRGRLFMCPTAEYNDLTNCRMVRRSLLKPEVKS